MTNNASAGFDSVVSSSYDSSSTTHHCSFSFSARSALAGLALFVLGASGCGGSASPPPSPTASPTPTIDMSYYGHQDTPAPVLTPTPLVIVWPTPTPRPTPPPLPAILFPTVEPTPTLVPTPTPTPTPSLEERIKEAKALIQKLSGSNETIKDYNTIKPIVDAVIGPTGLKYDNIKVTILPQEEFNKQYCGLFMKNEPRCLELLKGNTASSGFVTGGGTEVFVQENPFYQTLIVTLREMLGGIGQYSDNKPSTFLSSEIYGNLGWSFANITLAEKFGYDPHNDIDDTLGNRQRIMRFNFHSDNDPNWRDNANAWLWLAWKHAQAGGLIERGNPAKMMTSDQALQSYLSFIRKPDTDNYLEELWAKRDAKEDAEMVIQSLLLRLNPNKQQKTELDKTVMREYLFYLPIGAPQR